MKTQKTKYPAIEVELSDQDGNDFAIGWDTSLPAKRAWEQKTVDVSHIIRGANRKIARLKRKIKAMPHMVRY